MALYLGLDSSTQSLSASIIDSEAGNIVTEATVSYGDDLPEYNCPQGVLPNADPLIKHADPAMWAAALDRLLAKLVDDHVPLHEIKGISGSGQQHGTVYLRAPIPPVPADIESLAEVVKSRLSRPTAPVWMDSSTHEECREINAAMGGAERVRERTGSSATERFSGPQIRRYAKTDPDGYRRTRMIHLVSSFLCSLLIGRDAPIDRGDGAGMNLLHLETGDWDPDMLDVTTPGLADRLPPVVPANHVAGAVAPYFVHTYGFAAETPVVVWSGDNPNSLIGVGGWRPGTAVISLGTSDTYFAAMPEPHVDPDGYGHVFGNPAGGFMSLICFKNGSLAREAVKEKYGLTWRQFDVDAFEQTAPGNRGNIMLPYFVPEITPLVLHEGVVKHGTQDFRDGRDANAAVRGIVEAQALSMRLHSSWIGPTPDAIRITGGASRSAGICQVIADVFDATVDRLRVGNSAALGAAMRAANAVGGVPWAALTERFCHCSPDQRVTPNTTNLPVYEELLHTYRDLENAHLETLDNTHD